jgi:hypothetical protein
LLLLPLLLVSPAHAEVPCDLTYEAGWGVPGDGPAEFRSPGAIAIGPDHTVWVVDDVLYEVRQYSPEGTLLRTLPSPDLPASWPVDVAVAGDGTVYVADASLHRIHVYSNAGAFLGSIVGGGNASTAFVDVWGVAVGPDGTLYVTDRGRDRVAMFTPALTYLRAFTAGAGFLEPMAIEVSPANGDVWVSAHGSGTVHRFDRNGVPLLSLPSNAAHLALDSEGNLNLPEWEAADHEITHIGVYSPEGSLLCRWGKAGTAPGLFGHVTGFAWSGSEIFVTDRVLDRVQRFGTGALTARRATWGQLKQIYR